MLLNTGAQFGTTYSNNNVMSFSIAKLCITTSNITTDSFLVKLSKIFFLCVIMLNVVILKAIMLNVIVLCVIEPAQWLLVDLCGFIFLFQEESAQALAPLASEFAASVSQTLRSN